MKLAHFTTVGNTNIAVNPNNIIGVSMNLNNHTILIHGKEALDDYGYFVVKDPFDIAISKIEDALK